MENQRKDLSLISDLVEKNSKILDVGCGEGSLLKTLLKNHRKARAMGIDISKKAIEIAKNHLPNEYFKVCDISTSIIDKEFDLIVSSDVLEHIIDDDMAIKNMGKMLKKDGRLIIVTLQGQMRPFETKVGHVRNYMPGELEQKIKDSGLEIEQVINWGWPFYSPLYRDLLNLTDNKGTMGKLGLIRITICKILYLLFCLNSNNRGDYIFVRAKKKS